MKLPRLFKFEIRNSKFGKALRGLRVRLGTGGGFTMIELLVVIAVIGVLAVAVLSSINPIEQVNKGRDTRARSDAAQLINAADRYFAIHEIYPWNFSSPSYTPDPAWDEFDERFDFDGASGNWGWVDALVTTAEVKAGFVNRLSDEGKLYVYKDAGANETMYTCFIPSSNAFVQEAADNCADGTTPNLGADIFCNSRDGSFDAANWICLP